MTPYFVAFFRNVNLGHPKSPTRAQLEAAFTGAGAAFAQSFQTNGTVIFSGDTEQAARDTVARACDTLREECGMMEPAFIASLPHLIECVDTDPFANLPPEGMPLASFLAPDGLASLSVAQRSPRGDVEIVRVTSQVVLSVSRKVMSSPGDPTPFLEKLLNGPATTRSWGTIQRLVRKYRQ
ncbi:MAG: DUF1697 domain-containing protein [Anaerolineales bacterium]|nr:DUF1697 domain-containing protein [Anaerolineales bacterium]